MGIKKQKGQKHRFLLARRHHALQASNKQAQKRICISKGAV